MKFTLITRESDYSQADYTLKFVIDDNIATLQDRDTLALMGFGKGSVADLPTSRTIYVSIRDTEPETIRLAIAKAVKALRGHKINTLELHRMGSRAPEEMRAGLMAIAEAFTLADYSFDKYKTEKTPQGIQEVLVSVSGIDADEAQQALDWGKAIAEATNYTRDIVNEIPEVYTPVRMEEDARKLESDFVTVRCQAYGPDYLREQGMNAFLAVNKSSPNEPRLIHLIYKPNGEAKAKYAFVGKGLTYDSGGLSLKPTSSMYTMKSDKSGAAAALGIIKAAATMELPFEVHAVLGATENMVGADAYKPDDVLLSKAGVTIEVNNTDAEGRLVLADCLAWAQQAIKPDRIIDMATLTGAVVGALGPFTSGVLGCNYDLQLDYKAKAQTSGEMFTVLEANDFLDEYVKSEIADIRNSCTGKTGGAITAGIFLSKFIQEEYKDKWLHIDIAGTAYADSPWGYNPAGATGAGVRANIYYLLSQMNQTV